MKLYLECVNLNTMSGGFVIHYDNKYELLSNYDPSGIIVYNNKRLNKTYGKLNHEKN